MRQKELNEIADRIRESSLPTHFDLNHSRLLIEVWRLVAQGKPVSANQIEQTALHLKMPFETARSFIDKVSERDESGNVVGIFGLSQADHPHKFFVNGTRFSTWCAWDALFLPPMLNKPAQIESVCPQTQETIRVRLSPQRVVSIEPATAVLSIVIPKAGNGLNCVEEVWSSFCCDVRFFQSEASARTWFSGKPRTASILTVEEGFRLGLLAFGELLEYV